MPSNVSKRYLSALQHDSYIMTNDGVDSHQTQSLIQLATQYTNDLNNLGLNYVTAQCRKMGYLVSECVEYRKPVVDTYVRVESRTLDEVKELYTLFTQQKEIVVEHRYKRVLDSEFEELFRQSQQLAHQSMKCPQKTRGKFMVDDMTLKGLNSHMQAMVNLHKYTYMFSSQDMSEDAPETFNQWKTDLYRAQWKRVVELFISLGNTKFRELADEVIDRKRQRMALEHVIDMDLKERNKSIVQWGIEDAKHVSRTSTVIDYIVTWKLMTKTLKEVRDFAESRMDFPHNCYKVLGIHQGSQKYQVVVGEKRVNRRMLVSVRACDIETLNINVLKHNE